MTQHLETIKKVISESTKPTTLTGGGHTVDLTKGQSVSFAHAITGKKVSGKFVKKVNRGGHQYAHVEAGDGAYHVPVHQIHGAKKIHESAE